MPKTAFFRFEASPTIGAGHAMRSCVLADELKERGWNCTIVTSLESCQFIVSLGRFERVDPDDFYASPQHCDLLVIDNYDLGEDYEKHFRPYAKKIMVIDDLADRRHDCDILLDQTYGRDADDYKALVPEHCKILAGGDYVLLRKEFTQLRPKALEKRCNTKEIKRILVSMGGSDPKNFTVKALEMVKESGFKGAIDVVLGFTSQHREAIETYVKNLPNECSIHVNPDMAHLMFDADLAIEAAGSSVWERCCLGLPSIFIITAENQKNNFESFLKSSSINSLEGFLDHENIYENNKSVKFVDGFGTNRVFTTIEDPTNNITFRNVTESDEEIIFQWQNIKEVRRYFNNPNPPSRNEHNIWFSQRLKKYESPYWVTCENREAIGIVSLFYNTDNHYYDLSWFLIPDKWGKGLGTQALKLALEIVRPFRVHAFIKQDNVVSHKALEKLGFLKLDHNNYISIPLCP